VVNRRETNTGRTRMADAGVCIKALITHLPSSRKMTILVWSPRAGSVTNRACWQRAPEHTSQWQGQTSQSDSPKDRWNNVSRCRRCLEKPPTLKEVFPNSKPRAVPTEIWVFDADISNELILGLDILLAYDASVGIVRQNVRLTEEELSLWSPGARPRPSSLVVAKDHVTHERCKRIVMTTQESPSE
jgi:hypothetical protein